MAATVEDANITLKVALTVTEFDYKEHLQKLKVSPEYCNHSISSFRVFSIIIKLKHSLTETSY